MRVGPEAAQSAGSGPRVVVATNDTEPSSSHHGSNQSPCPLVSLRDLGGHSTRRSSMRLCRRSKRYVVEISPRSASTRRFRALTWVRRTSVRSPSHGGSRWFESSCAHSSGSRVRQKPDPSFFALLRELPLRGTRLRFAARLRLAERGPGGLPVSGPRPKFGSSAHPEDAHRLT